MRFNLSVLAALAAAVVVALTITPAATPAAAPVAAPAAPSGPLATVTATINGATVQLTNLTARVVQTATGPALRITGTATCISNPTTCAAAGFTQTTGPFTILVNSLIGAQANGTCTILDLTLGPLHLDLLGLVVDLNQLHLTITGQTGPGNLLGNLLCGLANALNPGGATLT
jgi:hypothetical protein